MKKTSSLLECDLFWEDDDIETLLSKEKEIVFFTVLVQFNVKKKSLVSKGFLLGGQKRVFEMDVECY